MPQSTENPLQMAVKALFSPIEDEMAKAEMVLQNELHNDAAFVNELLEYCGRLGGKRLRPALLLLTAKASGSVTDQHLTLAAIVEMIHTATLVHDDVLDEAEQRRHLATVNSRWNNETSVLLGDYLFTHAFYLASTLDTTYGCRRIGQSTNIVCEGELRQIASRGNHALSEDEYYSIINGKTAELCACACHLGAYYSSSDEEAVTALEQYGRSLGMAFQIADDLLDLLGDESQTGKSLGTDLDKQKPTLPIIHVYQSANATERAAFTDLLESETSDKQAHIHEWLERFDAIDYARLRAADFASTARDQLDVLPDGDCKDVLRDLTDFVVSRSM